MRRTDPQRRTLPAASGPRPRRTTTQRPMPESRRPHHRPEVGTTRTASRWSRGTAGAGPATARGDRAAAVGWRGSARACEGCRAASVAGVSALRWRVCGRLSAGGCCGVRSGSEPRDGPL